MNVNLSVLGLIEIICSLSTGVAILFFTYKLLQWFKKRYVKLDEANTAFRVFMAGVLFGVGHIISGVIQPILTSFRLLSSQTADLLLLEFLGYSTIYVAIAYSSALLICLLGVNIYRWLTPIDEFKEIREDNVGVAVVTATIIIILAMMSKDGIVLLIESLIPYPVLPPM